MFVLRRIQSVWTGHFRALPVRCPPHSSTLPALASPYPPRSSASLVRAPASFVRAPASFVRLVVLRVRAPASLVVLLISALLPLVVLASRSSAQNPRPCVAGCALLPLRRRGLLQRGVSDTAGARMQPATYLLVPRNLL